MIPGLTIERGACLDVADKILEYVEIKIGNDIYCVVEDHNPEFGHSIHRIYRTRFGANKEMRRMCAIASKKCNRNNAGKITTHYRVVKRKLLD